MQIYEIIGDVKGKKILLLQGPMGYFFDRLDKHFVKYGAETFRIGLNAADAYFANKNHYTGYKGRPEEWDIFIEAYLIKYQIEILFLFGDCRFYQSQAIKVAKKIGVRVFVFEEGYIRPDFITLEENGVNGYSVLSKERSFYDVLNYNDESECHRKNIKKIGSTYTPMALQAIVYYIVADTLKFLYPYYQHHRVLSAPLEAFYGIRNFIRKQFYRLSERNLLGKVVSYSLNYYFVPLQTHGDFQITRHSKYEDMEEFINEVLLSFASHAPKESCLFFKHHPMDRGKKNYTNFIMSQAKDLGCSERIIVCHDVHLPTLLKHARATITINSTVGLSSLYHKTPTLCMGNAFYDIKGLTSKGISLDEFWHNHKEVESELFDKYRCYLIEKTQINGSFYV